VFLLFFFFFLSFFLQGGTGAAPPELTNRVGAPLIEGLILVKSLVSGIGASDRIKIIAAGKVLTGFDLVRTMALGADLCNAARPFMFSLGCIQALACHSGDCPTGITSHRADRQIGLDVEAKAHRVATCKCVVCGVV
jgi:glutamate synthase domain-containing protein 2